jgi:hypothetical protein
MWKIVLVLLFTALAMLAARLVDDPTMLKVRIGGFVSEMRGGISAPLTPPLMYAGIRG